MWSSFTFLDEINRFTFYGFSTTIALNVIEYNTQKIVNVFAWMNQSFQMGFVITFLKKWKSLSAHTHITQCFKVAIRSNRTFNWNTFYYFMIDNLYCFEILAHALFFYSEWHMRNVFISTFSSLNLWIWTKLCIPIKGTKINTDLFLENIMIHFASAHQSKIIFPSLHKHYY